MVNETWQSLPKSVQEPFRVYAKNLTTGDGIAQQEHEPVETASTIKLLILLCLLRRVQDRKLSLADLVHVRPEERISGSGVLMFGRINAPFELYNLAMLMMAVSDNTATNTIIRLVGKDVINEYAQSIGLTATRLLVEHFKVRGTTPDGFLIGATTPSEMARLVELLVTNMLLDAHHTKIALSFLDAVQGSSFSRRINLSKLKHFGSKPGWFYVPPRQLMVLGEAGLIVSEQPRTTTVFALYGFLPLDKHLPYALDSSGRQAFGRAAAAITYELVFNH